MVAATIWPAYPHSKRPRPARGVEQLTEALIDALIEMIDLMDGDPDIEANGDEAEEGDGILAEA